MHALAHTRNTQHWRRLQNRHSNHWFKFSSYMDNRFVCYFPGFVCAFFFSSFFLTFLSLSHTSIFIVFIVNLFWVRFSFISHTSLPRPEPSCDSLLDFIEWNVALPLHSRFPHSNFVSFPIRLTVCLSLFWLDCHCCRCDHMPTSDCTLCFRIRYDYVANVLLNFKVNDFTFGRDLLFHIRSFHITRITAVFFCFFFLLFCFFSKVVCPQFFRVNWKRMRKKNINRK